MKDQDNKDKKSPPSQSAGCFEIKHRITAFAVLFCAGGILVTGACLKPDVSGSGTHRQLNLPSCSWMIKKGIPCPTCGMTTSVTSCMNGRLDLACKAQPFGIVFTLFLAVACVIALIQLVSRRDRLGWFLRKWKWILTLLIVGTLLGWIVKLALGYASGIYPTH